MEINHLVPLHIIAGGIALLCGAGAIVFRKGSPRHRVSGLVFFVSMLIMSASGALMAWFQPAGASVVAGLLTFYMVASGWLAIRQRPKTSGWSLWVGLLAAVAVAILGLSWGFEATATESGSKDGYPAGIYLAFGGIAALAAILDLSVIVRGGVTGVQRIARHLWRMMFAMLMATASFFLGQAQVFPELVRRTEFLAAPVVVVIGVLVYWIIRVLFTRWRPRTGT